MHQGTQGLGDCIWLDSEIRDRWEGRDERKKRDKRNMEIFGHLAQGGRNLGTAYQGTVPPSGYQREAIRI